MHHSDRLICPLTWWDVVHQYAVGGNVEHHCAAKIRPLRPRFHSTAAAKPRLRAPADLDAAWRSQVDGGQVVHHDRYVWPSLRLASLNEYAPPGAAG